MTAPTRTTSSAGLKLVEAALAASTARGYERLVLDTLPSMKRAVAIYHRLGFKDIAPYYPSPIPGTHFLGKALQSSTN